MAREQGYPVIKVQSAIQATIFKLQMTEPKPKGATQEVQDTYATKLSKIVERALFPSRTASKKAKHRNNKANLEGAQEKWELCEFCTAEM